MALSRTETSVIEFNNHALTDESTAPSITSTPSPLSSTASTTARVAILLCTYQGSRYLAEQLDSIRTQDHKNLVVCASDDGSEDNTRELLGQHQNQWNNGNFSICSGPQQGYTTNFLSLVCQPDITADFFAYADQDDIWEPDKLSRAIAKLEQIPPSVPALYCGRTCLIDENGKEIGLSPLFEKPPSFANAIVQNIGGGNTMVMNKAAREVLRSAGEKEVVYHDWWTYQLITAAGGTVIYDPTPTVRYRQHSENAIGVNTDWRDRFFRIRLLLKGRFRNWNTLNSQALQEARHLITPENQRILDNFCAARNRWLLPRLWGVWRSGVYRQTLLGNLALIAATFLKQI